jgi:hypothetical protein
MGQAKPICQLLGGLVWCLPVERHHGRWHPGAAQQLRAPPVADGHHLDVVRTAANSLLKAMNAQCCDV